jgi:antitoxin VapB
MPLYINYDEVAQLVTELAKRRGTTKREAVKIAVRAALDQDPPPMTPMEKLGKFWAEHPLPPPTGEVADKAFFDALSGDL